MALMKSEMHDLELDLCELQDEERKRKAKERETRLKGVVDLRRNVCRGELDRSIKEPDPTGAERQNQLTVNTDRSWIITHTQNRRGERKSLQEYIRKNNEIFTLQYTLNVKRNEIERVETQLRSEERALTRAEKQIVEDSKLFDQFLDASSRNANEAALRAEDESRKKEGHVNEIKRLQKILITYQNDKTHLTDVLKQSRRYQQFLFKFAPADWRDEHLERLAIARKNSKLPSKIKSASTSIDFLVDAIEPEIDFSNHTDEDYVIYFTEPQQLLDIFTEMEEKSLPLVQKSQDASEALDEMRTTINITNQDEYGEVERLETQINRLEDNIREEIEKEIACKNAIIQYKKEEDPLIQQIHASIKTIFKRHIMTDDAGMSTMRMLQAIESKIEHLFSLLERMNVADVTEAEKSREISVRTTERQEKLRQEEVTIELKRQKALLRAIAPPYSKLGRKIMERSCPIYGLHQVKQKSNNKQEQLVRLLVDPMIF